MPEAAKARPHAPKRKPLTTDTQCRNAKPFAVMGSNDTGIEAYSSDRYFTVTGSGAGRHDPCDLTSFVVLQLQPAYSRGKTDVPAAEAEHVETVDPKTVNDLRSALFSIPSDERDLWVRMGHALKPLGNVGQGLWMVWSSTSDKFDAADAARVWQSFKPNNTGYQAVFAEAPCHGWLNPMSNAATKAANSENQAIGAPAPPVAQIAFWSSLVDPFGEATVPPFPTECLPEALNTFCKEYSDQSGFDAGGYGFAFLVAASSMIDHRLKLNVGPLHIPAFLWGNLVGAAGTGKSPMIECPSCTRRCAVLYFRGATVPCCLVCMNIAYPSQSKGSVIRGIERNQQIYKKLGWDPGQLSTWCRPKGMWRKTLFKLTGKLDNGYGRLREALAVISPL